MKLLFDQNISSRLVGPVTEFFPDSSHVTLHDLSRAGDAEIWNFAREHGFVIVTKDEDFHQRSFLEGAPPKVIWLRLGNCTTDEIETLLLARLEDVLAFGSSEAESYLTLS